MQNVGLILVILIVAALAYLRFQQPDTWNQYVQMLKVQAPAAVKNDASTSSAPDATPTGT